MEQTVSDAASERPGTTPAGRLPVWFGPIPIVALLAIIYAQAFRQMYTVWTSADSYYSHGFLVPPISLYLVWLKRRQLRAAPVNSSLWGYVCLGAAAGLLLLGAFLGFAVVGQISLVLMLFGIVLALLGRAYLRLLWFPTAFLVFMIPIPPSFTQSIALDLKLFATACAVSLARLAMLPVIHEGSFVYFRDDSLLIGEVCGGLRSLISMLAVGALMAYFSKARTWARVLTLVLSVPIAIVANVFRILLLCVVGCLWGSKTAGGMFHDVSGILMFALAFMLFFMLEGLVRKVAPVCGHKDQAGSGQQSLLTSGFRRQANARAFMKHYVAALVLLSATTAWHAGIHYARRHAAAQARPAQEMLSIPPVIGPYTQDGPDADASESVKRTLETSVILMRSYRGPNRQPIDLAIVYAGSTRRSLHFPEVCLVGQGWEIREQTTMPVEFMFSATRLVLVKNKRNDAVLYWYKTGDTLTGNFFVNSWHWAYEQLTKGAATSSMIRVSTPIINDDGESAFQLLEDFAAKLTPILLERVD